MPKILTTYLEAAEMLLDELKTCLDGTQFLLYSGSNPDVAIMMCIVGNTIINTFIGILEII